MTLYTEVDWNKERGGTISSVQSGSVAGLLSLQVGDELLAINGNKVSDVIDVQYYGAEEELELLIRRSEELLLFEGMRDYGQHLGITFQNPTFDIDIRRCNNLCEFCFVLQMAPRFRRTLYIKDDDYRYSFLFGHFVTLTNLDDHDWWRINTMRLSPLYISVHVTDLDLRRKFLRNPDAPDIMVQLEWLADRNIEMHTQLVVVPEFNDGKYLTDSIDDLASLWPAIKSVSVVPVGLTKYHKYNMRGHSAREAANVLDSLAPITEAYRHKFGKGFIYPTDEWYLISGRDLPEIEFYDDLALHENGLGMVRKFLDEWTAVKQEIETHLSFPGSSRPAFSHLIRDGVCLVTGAMFASTLTKIGHDFEDLTGIKTTIKTVKNEQFGSTITAAGLLIAEDIINQLVSEKPAGLLILPRVVFDHPQFVSLDDYSPRDVAKALDRPLILADLMGDVWDACLDGSALRFTPE